MISWKNLKDRYYKSGIHRNVCLNRWSRDLNRRYRYTLRGQKFYQKGVNVLDEDWDNLIILDACRYDIFEELNHINGNLTQKKSRGCRTPEWIRGNFSCKELLDTVYISANPQYSKLHQDIDSKNVLLSVSRFRGRQTNST